MDAQHRQHVFLVADGSTGDIIAPVSVAAELNHTENIRVFGVFDQSARALLLHKGFADEIATGQIQFAAVNYAKLLRQTDMGGRIKNIWAFLQVVHQMLTTSIPLMLREWVTLLEALDQSHQLDDATSVIVGNDLGATWLAPAVSTFLPQTVQEAFVSINAHPWSPNSEEFRYHPTPHFVHTPFIPAFWINKIFRTLVKHTYARIGERFVEEQLKERHPNMMPFDDIIDTVRRYYAFDPIVLTPREQARQRSSPTVPIGGYVYDLAYHDVFHPETREILQQAEQTDGTIITITLGSLTGTPANQQHVLSQVVDACRLDGTHIILVGGYAHDVIRPSTTVTLVPFENYVPLFKQSDLVIISGAAGTFHHALLTGTPAVCIPALQDQVSNAQWLVAHGLALGFVRYAQLLNRVQADEKLRSLIRDSLSNQRLHQTCLKMARQITPDGLLTATRFTKAILNSQQPHQRI